MFVFNKDEYESDIKFRSVELDNDVILTSLNNKFDEVIKRRKIDNSKEEFSTTGTVVNERLGARKW
jgi:hypothetical protein